MTESDEVEQLLGWFLEWKGGTFWGTGGGTRVGVLGFYSKNLDSRGKRRKEAMKQAQAVWHFALYHMEATTTPSTL